MAKRYRDIAGDGGSDVAGQLAGHRQRLRARMNSVKWKIAVMSGKGGVGKSTITVNLAAGLAAGGLAVGVVDADIYGPSLAQMFGLRGHRLAWREEGVTPAETPSGVKLMSMDFMLPEDRSPVVWDGPQEESFAWKGTLEMHALREFLTDTVWGELDLLLIDLPPGTNQFATLHELLNGLDGVVVVSMPTRVSRLVVRRSITMATQNLKAPVLGVVENMTAYYCTECGAERPLFGKGANADYDGVPILGSIPFDPRMVQACDAGRPFVVEYGETPAGKALAALCEGLNQAVAATSGKEGS